MNKVVLDSVDAELINILVEKLRFSYEIITPRDGEYGRQLPDGNWTEMVGMLLQQEADIAVHELAITEERSNIIYFSYPYVVSRVNFATNNLETLFSKTAFLEVFSLTVWIFIFISFFLMFIMFILFKWHPFIGHNKVMLRKNTIEKTYAGQSICKITFGIGQFFLRWFHSALLLSILSLPSLVGVRTIAELATAVRDGKYRCITTPGAYTPDTLLKNSKSGDYINIIGQSLKENKGNMNFQEVLNDTYSSKKPAFVTFELRFLAFKDFYFISDEGVFVDFQGIGVRKDFCCITELNMVLHYLWSSGINMKILNNALTIKRIRAQQQIQITDEKTRKLSIENLGGVFILLLTGHILGAIVLLIEILFHKILSYRKLRRS